MLLGGTTAAAAELPWTKLDVDKNGRFDRADIEKVLGGGPDRPTLDVNGDGKKDRADATALYLALWRDDRTADLKVTADDFATPPRISLEPATDLQVSSLALRLVSEARLPPGQETLIRAQWDLAKVKEPLAAMYERAGPAALLAKNLDVATWAFAKSLTLEPRRVAALNGLGFVLIEQGRDAEAAGVLARAAQLGPNVCAVQANLGFVAARANLLEDAHRAYSAAIEKCPGIAQYRLNRAFLGVRMRKPPKVVIEDAEEASKSSPGDIEAATMIDVLDPGNAPSREEARAAWERYRAALNAEPWSSLSPCDQGKSLLEAIDYECGEKWDAKKKNLTDELDRRLKGLAAAVMPAGQSYCADIKRWAANVKPTLRACQNVQRMAEMDAGSAFAQLMRSCNRQKVAAIPLLFELASEQAKADAKAATRVLDAHQRRALGARIENAPALAAEAYAEAMRYCYTEPVRGIALQARAISDGPQRLETRGWQQDIVAVGPFVIMPMALAKKGYGGDCDAKLPTLNADASLKWSLSLVLVQIEYDFSENEVKLQVGQGLIVAGTWSPERGFGFQAGVGFDLDAGPIAASAVTYWKIGSDGSFVEETELGAGVNVGVETLGVEASTSETLMPAQHAPVGSW